MGWWHPRENQNTHGQCKSMASTSPDIKNSGIPNLKLYPLRQVAPKGIKPVLKKFLKTGLIKPSRFLDNIPILLVKKPNWIEYCFVQDLRAVNEIVQDLHLVVPNLYTLLTIPGEYSCFSVWGLKDTFLFCNPITGKSQQLFSFHPGLRAGPRNTGSPTVLLVSPALRIYDFSCLFWGDAS